MSLSQDVEVLRTIPLFAKIEPSKLKLLAFTSERLEFMEGDELVRQGDVGDAAYIILEGAADVMVDSPGGAVKVAQLKRNDIIGEIAILCDVPRTATVVAIQDAMLLLIDRRELFPFLRRHPDAAIKLLEVLALRVQKLTAMMEDTTFLNLPQRLGKRLLDLAERYGKRTPEGVRIEMKINQTELGDLVATTRESINKQFRAWSEDGVASMSGGYVTILDEDALRRVVEQE